MGVRRFMIALAFACLFAGGLAAALGGADSGNPPAPAPSATAASGSVRPNFVSGLGFSCDRAHWHIGFTLERPATVSGRLDRRLRAAAPVLWTVERRFAPRRLLAGPHALELGTHPSGIHRVTLGFRTAAGSAVTRVMVFGAGCKNPPPPPTTPTLPTDPGRQ